MSIHRPIFLNGAALALCFSSLAKADLTLVQPPELGNEDLIATAFSLCLGPMEKTRSAFIESAAQHGFKQVGQANRGVKVLSFEDADGRLASLFITGLEGKPGLFECGVSSTGPHNAIEQDIEADLRAEFDDVKDFPLNGGWIFNQNGTEYVVSVRRNTQHGTTAVIVAFSGTNK